MRVLVTRGGELATVFGPVCGWSGCPCWKGGVGLEHGHSVDDGLVVAERADLTFEGLKAACAALLERKGWPDDDGEYAEMMSDEAAEIAEQCEPGTRLWPEYNGELETWDWYDEPDDGDDDDPNDGDPDGPLMMTEVLTSEMSSGVTVRTGA